MVDVETEVNKHRNCNDRDEVEKLIKFYKDLALKNASNIITAGKYTMVARKLQEMCNQLPAPPRLRNVSGTAQSAPVKTAAITNDEKTKINADWQQRTEGTRKVKS